MAKNLKIWLPDDWADISDQNPDGPLTLCWQDPKAAGAFQISTAEYNGGEEPRPSQADLIGLAVEFGEKRNWGKPARSFGGQCVMGLFGTAAFSKLADTAPDSAYYSQVWYLSNGLDFVFATFFAAAKPDDRELASAQRIAEGIDFR